MSDAPLDLSLRPGRSTTLVRAGGALGIAGCMIGLLVFITACAGFDAVFYFSPIPFLMGVVGLVMVIAGGVQQRTLKIEDMHVVAAFFVTLIATIGGLVELAAWRHWTIFFGQGA
jgi:hypothetical protein